MFALFDSTTDPALQQVQVFLKSVNLQLAVRDFAVSHCAAHQGFLWEHRVVIVAKKCPVAGFFVRLCRAYAEIVPQNIIAMVRVCFVITTIKPRIELLRFGLWKLFSFFFVIITISAIWVLRDLTVLGCLQVLRGCHRDRVHWLTNWKITLPPCLPWRGVLRTYLIRLRVGNLPLHRHSLISLIFKFIRTELSLRTFLNLTFVFDLFKKLGCCRFDAHLSFVDVIR